MFCYLRAYAINEAGTAYGNQVIFRTMTGIVTDYDGNNYYTIKHSLEPEIDASNESGFTALPDDMR